MRVANWVIHRLDIGQEERALETMELWLRRTLKHALLGLAALERTIDRQRSRMKWLKEGDANTKLFQAIANGRRSKNFITHIKREGEIISDKEKKEEAFFQAYENLLGKEHTREHSLDLQYLGVQAHNLNELEGIITEEEVWGVIKELPPDRAPSPDGYIAAFYQKAWPIIKNDVMAVMLKLYVGDGRGFAKLNKAHIVLIPKKPDVEEIDDFRPISLTHSMPKLFAKVPANRLRKQMPMIVGANQSAFIKG